MPDIIQLLPDSIANQIAAGEVIQRPASVIKELLENAVDAGATQIKLIIKDAGKTSIQVIDDGKGMSETDARMAFERHATSKIKSANDLFCIKTMGFRGEALASIAAIAHVELTTRQAHEDTATKIQMEGSMLTKQEKVQAMPGTNITVKNLFYNVPARRKFLKSDPVELKHIMDEFHRVSLANTDIFFTLHHNGNEVYHLPKSNLKQRILGVMGKQMNEKLIPINQETEAAAFSGFIGKPDTAKKTQGEQFIFVNKRFIKSNYLNHAIRAAYEDLLPKDMYTPYFLFLEIDPATIDINVHPTKTEIKFEDERLIYNYLRVSLKHSLGQYSLGPMLDFNTDQNFFSNFKGSANIQQDQAINTGEKFKQQPNSPSYRPDKTSVKNWEDIYFGMENTVLKGDDHHENQVKTLENEAYALSGDEDKDLKNFVSVEPYQLHKTYIIYQVKTGMMIIDQQAAHERILYEQYLEILKNGEYLTQKELFPRTVELDPSKSDVLKSILDKVKRLGFDIEEFGHHSFIVHGTPSGLDVNISLDEIIDKLISQYIGNLEFELGIEDNLARSMAISAGIKRGYSMEKQEMKAVIDLLFGCQLPQKSPSGKKCYIIIEHDELGKRFNQ